MAFVRRCAFKKSFIHSLILVLILFILVLTLMVDGIVEPESTSCT